MTVQEKFPIPTPERESVEEALGLLWHRREEGVVDRATLEREIDTSAGPGTYGRLIQDGLVRVEEGRLVTTPSGETIAAAVTRRHRLAERLLTDVLSLDQQAVDPNACQLEHIISDEVTASICTLLGHPQECPHGLAIPPGPCCQRSEKAVAPIVVPLSELKAGQKGRIAYLQMRDHPELHRLLSLGVVPGAEVRVHQTFPTFVVGLGESDLAFEEAVAQRIHVRH